MMNRTNLRYKTEAQENADIRKAMRGSAIKTGVFSAEKLIHLALERHEDTLAVSWSGGRCSTAVLRLALDIKPTIKAIFNNTGVEYPETIRFVSAMAEKWGVDLIITSPGVTFWEIVKKHGLPKIRKAGGGGPGKPKCCYYLKEKPLKITTHEHGIEATLDGIRVCEARVRMFATARDGQFVFVRRSNLNVWKYHPIAFWSSSQLARFERVRGLPINPIYKKYELIRSGCWPCTGYKDWERVMARTHPKYLLKMKELMGQHVLDHYYRSRVDPPCRTEGER